MPQYFSIFSFVHSSLSSIIQHIGVECLLCAKHWQCSGYQEFQNKTKQKNLTKVKILLVQKILLYGFPCPVFAFNFEDFFKDMEEGLWVCTWFKVGKKEVWEHNFLSQHNGIKLDSVLVNGHFHIHRTICKLLRGNGIALWRHGTCCLAHVSPTRFPRHTHNSSAILRRADEVLRSILQIYSCCRWNSRRSFTLQTNKQQRKLFMNITVSIESQPFARWSL